MKTLACTFALLFALASPAFAQWHEHGGHGYGHWHGGYHEGWPREGWRHHRHHWRDEGERYRDYGEERVVPFCGPVERVAGMCGY